MRALLVLLVLSAIAHAQPTGNHDDAKALVTTGVKLLNGKDYLGALAAFKEAYARYPSAKILLNIGTTEKLLGRDVDAANTYQSYLDAADTDPAHATDVRQALAELDAKVGHISLQVTPPDSEIQIATDWLPPAKASHVRVAPGDVTVHVRHAGYETATTTLHVTAGTESVSTVSLTKSVATTSTTTTTQPTPTTTTTTTTTAQVDPRLKWPHDYTEDMLPSHWDKEEHPARARFGALANVHVAVYPKLGSAWLVGATVDALPALSIDAALLLGPGLVSDGMATLPPPSFGGYVGASYALKGGSVRPCALVGLPVFASDGARYFVRLGGAVEYSANRHVAVILELAGEIAINPQNDIRQLAVVPALGVTGRL